ncbi:MAG: AEC family transporter [Oscillospiraceae bacterium]|nr:AEC family transporter [Oscillospiraceae bacterium]
MPLFFDNIKLAMANLAMLYLIVAVGVFADRIGWFPEAAARKCTELLFYIITPCVILRAFFTMEYSPAALRGLLIALGCGTLLHLTGILASEPFFRKGKNPLDSILHYAAVYGNCGYMALPLAQALVGDEGVFYCSAVVLVFQMFSFTHGAYVMSGGIPGRRLAEGEARARFPWRSLILNAGVLPVLVGFPLFALGLRLPELVTQPVGWLASMNTPLAMLMFGTYLSRTNFRAILRGKKLPISLAVKLFAVPSATLAALLLAGVRGPLLHAMLIPASSPSANSTVVFAAKYGNDAGYASQVVAVMSLLSILTMPLMIAIGLTLAG